jgi:hypothetical protein
MRTMALAAIEIGGKVGELLQFFANVVLRLICFVAEFDDFIVGLGLQVLVLD